ncbi:MAG: dTDP-glucose 4,6-dehydratase [Elusimicrobia bacterium]|nr:dTDP-glucose 4,6-dehydratase [Elusimicrobiota bacterium]
MRLLVTGGAGFIGSHFIRHRLDGHPDDTVVNYDLLTYAGDLASLADVEARHAARYTFIRGDIADEQRVAETLRAYRPDLIVNFAAESHNSRAVKQPSLFVRTNVVGTQVLLDGARTSGVERFHHISTCEVYGDLDLESPDAFTETSPYRPRTPYNASKAAADMLVRAYHQTFGLATTITNCSNNYGPWQHPEKVIPLFVTNAIEGAPLPLYRSSANRREWLHVIDHCRAIDRVLADGRIGETYNVGSGDERSIEEIADAVLGVLGLPASLRSYVEDRPGHDRRYLLDHTKISRELGWQPEIPFERGLAETVEWYRQHRDWWIAKKRRATSELDETAWARR